jgi:hypothetical protein
LTGARFRIPSRLAYSQLVNETVVFDLQTGAYHSLPRRAGQVLALIDRHGNPEHAAAELARKTGRPLDTLRAGVAAYCLELVRSGLLEVDRRPRRRPPSRAA